MCNACFNEDRIKSSTTFSLECDGCTIVIRNVPCFECRVCGETTFTDEVSARLEEIVGVVKAMPQELAVKDYLKFA